MQRGRKQYKPSVFYRRNYQITAQTIRLIADDGRQIGVVSREDALKMSQDQNVDLVEIGPTAIPPVVKLIDYSKFLYQLKKKKQEEKKKTQTSETKQIQLGPFIDDHDLDIKLKRADEFIKDGDKVKFVLKFRGREITKKELGEEVLKKVMEKMQSVAKVEKDMHMEGRQMILVMSKLK